MTYDSLAREMDGPLHAPGDERYDDARRVFNGRFDPRPDAIASCGDAEDVARAVKHATSSGTPLTVKSGGHSYAGKSAADGGLLVDLSAMTSVTVDPHARTVTVGPGARWGAVDAATVPHGLAAVGATVSAVGVAGYALHGGTANLSRAHGLAADNIVSVELVTADGRVVVASEEEHPDLFWAVRGAGANFGIATSIELRLHDIGEQVLSGQIIYPFDDAARLIRAYREFMADAPDELQCFLFMFRVPPIEPFPEDLHGEPVVDFVVFHKDAGAEDVFAPLRRLGEPILDAVAPVPYPVAQTAFDANLPAGPRYHSKAHDLAEITDDAIDAVVEFVPRMVGPLTSAYFEPMGGQIARIDPASNAIGERRLAAYGFHVLGGWTDPADDDTVIGWTRDFHDAMAPHATGTVYVNLLGEDEDERVPAAYGDYERLRELKASWDPDNVFSANHNVVPAN